MHNIKAHVIHRYQQDHSELSSVICICEAAQFVMLPKLCRADFALCQVGQCKEG